MKSNGMGSFRLSIDHPHATAVKMCECGQSFEMIDFHVISSSHATPLNIENSD